MIDSISLQVLLWLSATVLVTLLICLCVVGSRAAEAYSAAHRARADIQEALARTAEANAKQIEIGYQKALLERTGELPPITLALDQSQINKLAMDYVTKRIATLKIHVET